MFYSSFGQELLKDIEACEHLLLNTPHISTTQISIYSDDNLPRFKQHAGKINQGQSSKSALYEIIRINLKALVLLFEYGHELAIHDLQGFRNLLLGYLQNFKSVLHENRNDLDLLMINAGRN